MLGSLAVPICWLAGIRTSSARGLVTKHKTWSSDIPGSVAGLPNPALSADSCPRWPGRRQLPASLPAPLPRSYAFSDRCAAEHAPS